jgi:hypothetical protein
VSTRDLTPALFVPVEGGWLPTAYATGPWSPDALHGGPVAALVARAVEQVPAPAPVRIARLTVELLHPVRHEPLAVRTRTVRDGRKVSTVDVRIERVGGAEPLVLARAQRIRTADVELPDPGDPAVPDLPSEASDLSGWPGASPAFHSHAVEHRIQRGSFGEPGPAFDWTRLLVPVVPGEEPTGWQRAAATADFTNGLSAVVPFDGSASFINPDLTVHLWREPVGEWVGTDARTRTSPTGIGLASTELWDRAGRIGLGAQSLLLERA